MAGGGCWCFLFFFAAIWVDLIVVVGCGAIGFGSRWRSVLGIGHCGDCVWDRFWVLVVYPSSVVWVSVPVAVRVSVVEPWLESVGAWVESVTGDGYFGLGWIGVKIGWCSWVFWRKRHGRSHSDHCHRHHHRHRRSSRCSNLADLSLSFLVVVCFNFWCRGWYWL